MKRQAGIVLIIVLIAGLAGAARGQDSLNVTKVGQLDIWSCGVAVSGNYAYVAAWQAGLRVINISNPYLPVEVGYYNTPNHAWDVAVSYSYAYVADDTGMWVVNISDTASPFGVGYCNMPGIEIGVEISGCYAYVAAWQAGLRVVNVSNPYSPVEVGYYDTPGYARDVAVSGSYVYVADGYYFGIYQFTPPSLDVTLTPLNPPIVVPANGGSFNFNASVQRTVSPQEPFTVWARDRHPNGTYTGSLLGPININPPVGINVTRQRTQVVPSSWPAGVHYYIGYAHTSVSYPATDADSFGWTKSTARDGGATIWEAVNFGEPFPSEEIADKDFHPSSFTLHPCTPNPFNAATVASFELRVASQVSLKVYDIAGRLVATLVDGFKSAGTYYATFDGSGLASGIYLARLEAGEYTAMQKMVLLK